MTMDLRDLRWVIAAAQHRSLRQAADALNVRQSTLSRTLRNVEHQIGAVLFERTNGGTRPTAAGQELVEAAQRIVDDTAAITERLRTLSRGETGRLTIGVHTSLSVGRLRETLIEYRRRFPNVEIYLIDGSSDHLISDLSNSTIDIAFVVEGNPRWSGKSLPVWSERVVVAIHEGHPLGQREVMSWDDIKSEILLLPQRGPGSELLKLIDSKLGVGATKILRHDVSLDRLLSLVSVGWGVLVALEGATGLRCEGVVYREVHDANGVSRLNFSSCWRQSNSNPTLAGMVGILRQYHPDLSLQDGLARTDDPNRI